MLFLFLPILTFTLYASPFVQSVAKQEIEHYGKLGYERRCAGCHGISGNGNGPAVQFLTPKPRDFTSGVFKFRSSALGTLPSDDDLMRTLSHGIPNSSMPEFSGMNERERFSIIQYIKTFSKTWEDETLLSPPVTGTPYVAADFKDYKIFIQKAAKGQKIYQEACITCHGLEGRGDGEGAEGLTDDWNNPIKPANLRLKTIKRGKTVNDIYTTLLAGVNGTPMPSFKDVYSDDDLWDVAAYVLYFRGRENGIYDRDILPLNKPEGE
jgi:cytochrome c oxidase cbb3-type subunit 2